MNSLLLTLTALLILFLSALFAAPLFIDWNDYRSVFETQATNLLGRQVKVGGKVHLVLLPAPELKFDDIKVADQAGRLDRPFLEMGSLEAWLNIGALLSGTVQAMASAPGTLKQQVDDGKMRVLANWGAERIASFPDLPTFRELGYKDVEFYIWAGLFAQSALLREGLLRTVQQLDPEGKDPALRQLVVIGHSQGGMLTRLMVTDSGNRF